MFLRTQYLQMTKAAMVLVDSDLVDATPAPILDVTARVHLYKDGPTPTLESVLADYTECDFPSYPSHGVVLASVLGPINLPNGQGMHQQIDFVQGSATPVPQEAKGMYITDTTSAILLGAEEFTEAVPFNVEDDALSYDLILAPPARWVGEDGE